MSWVMGIIICVVVIGALAIRRAKMELWAGAVLGQGVVFMLGGASGLALFPGLTLGLLTLEGVRKTLVTKPLFNFTKKILPKLSQTEQEALDAGTVAAQVLCTLKA